MPVSEGAIKIPDDERVARLKLFENRFKDRAPPSRRSDLLNVHFIADPSQAVFLTRDVLLFG